MTGNPADIRCEPDPANPGWLTYELAGAAQFNRTMLGGTIVRVESEDIARLRLVPAERHLNAMNNVHGGVLLSLADVSLFAALHVLRGVDAASSVTIDLQCQFIAGASGDQPVDALPEVLRETRRLAFLRGLIVQGETRVAAYSATVRKG